jgi:negative regulator of flagellin synthesis FlgM
MSEINTIKTTGQPGLDVTQKINAKTNTSTDKTLSTQSNESTVDTLSLTNTATQLQSIQESLADAAPTVDADRVSSLKAAIAEGSYNVEPAELANNMINFEQQLG